ncbi:MAG TPA: hypothetical protein PK047_10450 [Saprospiraceae bacterium]|nr:hypothetical protein [Saprospiraceae bacterium]HRO09276.1 hypothetical protein [Saprospiraceae bacterium]HRP42308.1 hypothetical protein [Saprospiraceae bacterium]
MKFLKTIIVLVLPFFGLAQSFPTDAKVLEDVKKYHGKIATAKVQNEWKLEKEAGYTFSNMAKRVVAATTMKENGVNKNLIGLAIYVRGGAGENWNFSRYFVTSSETIGLTMLNETQLKEQTIELLRTNPGRVLVNYTDIAWVYGITFPVGLKSETDRTGDIIYKAEIEYEQKFISSYPFEGGLKRFKAPLEIYVRPVGGVLKVAVASVGYSESFQETRMTEKQHNALIVLGQKPFDELYGPQGPAIPGNKTSEKAKENKNAESNTTSDKKELKLPKLKIKGF